MCAEFSGLIGMYLIKSVVLRSEGLFIYYRKYSLATYSCRCVMQLTLEIQMCGSISLCYQQQEKSEWRMPWERV